MILQCFSATIMSTDCSWKSQGSLLQSKKKREKICAVNTAGTGCVASESIVIFFLKLRKEIQSCTTNFFSVSLFMFVFVFSDGITAHKLPTVYGPSWTGFIDQATKFKQCMPPQQADNSNSIRVMVPLGLNLNFLFLSRNND